MILYLTIFISRNHFSIKLILRIALRVVLISIGFVLFFAFFAVVWNLVGRTLSPSEVESWFGPGVFGGLLLGVFLFVGGFLRWGGRGTREDNVQPGGATAQDVLPLADYHVDETGYWKRIPLVSGSFFGVWMGAYAAIFPLDDSNLLYSRLTRVLIALIGGGLFFGLLFSFLVRGWTLFTLDSLYARKRWIDVPPPAKRRLDFRLLCVLMTGWRSEVGGVMYLGPDGLIFLPHKRNRRKAEMLEMGPLSGVKISTTDAPTRNALQRILIVHPQPMLEVQWPKGKAKFLVPSVTSTTARLSSLAAILRGENT